jgi:hypothetical protein
MNSTESVFHVISEIELQVSVEESPTGWIIKLDNFKVLSSQDHLYSLNKTTSLPSNTIPNNQIK